jgi:hypothetical protein
MPSSLGVRINVTTTPTLLASAKGRDQRAYIQIDNDSDKTIYTAIGLPAVAVLVSPTTGRPLAPGGNRSINNSPTDSEATGALYAVVVSGTASILVTEGT